MKTSKLAGNNGHKVNFLNVLFNGTHKVEKDILQKKTVYHSTVLALSGVALGYISQITLSNDNLSLKNGWFLLISVIGLAGSLLLLLLLHFISVLHGRMWGRVVHLGVKGADESIVSKDPSDPATYFETDYFKQNKGAFKELRVALKASAFFFRAEIILDFLILLSLSSGVISFVSYVIYSTI